MYVYMEKVRHVTCSEVQVVEIMRPYRIITFCPLLNLSLYIHI